MKALILAPLGLALSLSAIPLAGAAILIGPPAQDTPYLQASDSPFAAVIGFSYFHLETFEDDSFNVPGVTSSRGVVIGPEDWGGLIDSVDADAGPVDGNGNGGRTLFGGGTVTFTFDAGVLGTLPTHAGIVWTDGQNPTFEAFDQNGILLGLLSGNHADGSFSGTTGEDRFYGVINDAGISSIRMTGASWELDHFQYGAQRTKNPPSSVPESGGTAACLVIGMLGLGVMGMTKKNR